MKRVNIRSVYMEDDVFRIMCMLRDCPSVSVCNDIVYGKFYNNLCVGISINPSRAVETFGVCPICKI